MTHVNTCEPLVFKSVLTQMAPNNENDDATKLRKRQDAVESIKRTPAYIITRLYYDEDYIATPDHNDLKMSKRQWEKSVMKWRAELREEFRELSMR